MKYLYTTILYLFFLPSVYGQVVTRSIKNKKVATRLSASNNTPHFRISQKVDVKSLLTEDEQDKNQGLPFRFGKACLVSLGLKDGQWTETPEGSVWQLEISSPIAYSINLQFDDFYLSEGAELVIYNSDRTMQIGPITAKENNPSRLFATDLIKGNSIILELFEPRSATEKSQLHLSNVVHGYKNMFENAGGYGQSASCNIDVACAQGNNWQGETNGVAMVLVDQNTRWCSGSIINNACQNLRAYFLTAFHCLDGGSNNWAFRFQYKSLICGGVDDITYATYNGSTLRASWANSDFALMELNQRPDATTGIRYLGWSRSATAPTSSVSLHHPVGDVMKISVDNEPATLNPLINWAGGTTSQPNTHWTTNFDAGTAEGGSSGGSLFDQNHRIVGQLHGGTTGCPPNVTKYYGRFDLSWTGGGTSSTRLSDWLSDDPAITTTNTILIPFISNSGSDAICTGNSRTFTLQNPPSGTVTWTTTANLTPSSGTGTTATVSSTAAFVTGSITFTVTPSFTCSNPLQLTYNVTGTAPTMTNLTVNGNVLYTPYHACPNQYYTLKVIPQNNTGPIVWKLVSGSATTSLNGDGTFVVGQVGKTQDGASIHVTATASNSCGSKTVDFWLQGKASYCTGSRLAGDIDPRSIVINPNPADSYLEITTSLNQVDTDESDISARMASEAFLAQAPIEIRLYNQFSQLVYSGISQGEIFRLNTQNLPRGTYFLHLIQDQQVIKKQIVINH